eukprot:2754630-Pyramimonas_sp.AAC.1
MQRLKEIKALCCQKKFTKYYRRLVKSLEVLDAKSPLAVAWKDGALFWNSVLRSVGHLMHVSTDCGLPGLDAVIQVCAFWHDHVVVKSSSIRRRKWKEWCGQAMESGARRARGYLTEKITPQKVQFKDMAEQSLDICSLEQRMREERLKWSTAWVCCDGPRHIPTCGTHPVPVMELPSAEEIQRISE